MGIAKVDGRIVHEYTGARREHCEYRPETILEFLGMMDFARLVGKEVV